MTAFFQRYATPFITGLFVISLISGIALFFHIGPSGFHGMHEWLSMVMILPFVLHLWRNWRPMTNYFRHAPMVIALTLSLVAGAVFLVPQSSDSARAGGPPQFQLAHQVMSQPLADLAPALGTTPEALGAKLVEAGFVLGDPAQSLTEMATASGKSEAELAAALIGG